MNDENKIEKKLKYLVEKLKDRLRKTESASQEAIKIREELRKLKN